MGSAYSGGFYRPSTMSRTEIACQRDQARRDLVRLDQIADLMDAMELHHPKEYVVRGALREVVNRCTTHLEGLEQHGLATPGMRR